MKIEIDWTCSDRFTKMILNKKTSSDGIFKGNFKDFLGLMKELNEELDLE